jgi:hypothetical protein
MSVAAPEVCLLRRLLEKSGKAGDPIAELASAFEEMQTLIETP